MEITKIYWREDAVNNLKDILISYHRHGRKVTKRVIEHVIKGLEALRKRPYNGYIESSMLDQPQKVYSHYVTKKGIKVLYYTENDALYIIDFWDD
jgi:hypothetical protein